MVKTPYFSQHRLVRVETEVYLQSSDEANRTECTFVCVRERKREDWKGPKLNNAFSFSFFHTHYNKVA